MDDFIGKARRDRQGKLKNIGKVVAKRIVKCIDFLTQPGIGIKKIRSLTGDENITSKHLLQELEDKGIKHLFALKSSSKLRGHVPKIKRWVKLEEDGRLIGIKRNIIYSCVKTNLVVIKDKKRIYLYISSCYCKGAKYV
jgi:hypothetical protein